MAEAATPVPAAPRTTFLRNVIWGWVGVAVNIVIGVVLSPIIVRKLGVEQYGVWILLFSTLDYFRMLDFGFRAAVVNACARCRARSDWAGVNRVTATAALYFLLGSTVCAGLVIALRDPLISALNVSPTYRPEARTLVVVIAAAIAVRLLLSPLTAVLEAFQRFDLVNRAYIASLVLRSFGSLAALLLGYGLLEMAYLVLVAQLLENVWTFVLVRTTVPHFRLSAASGNRQTFIELFQFGRYSAIMAAANLVSIHAPTTVLGFLRGPTEVAFFSLPFRLLMYSAEGLSKVSDVTSSVTAGLGDSRSASQVWSLAILTNRHCFALFMPVAIFLVVWGRPLLQVWVSPEVAEHSGPLIPVLLIMFLFGVAGQYNAGAILIGQGKHAVYSYAVVIEVVISVVALCLVVPAYGVLGAAWVASLTFVGSRGLFLAVLICRENGFLLGDYLWAIYARALALAAPLLLFAWWLHRAALPGRNWPELIAAGGLITALYYAAAFFVVMEESHRRAIVARVSGR